MLKNTIREGRRFSKLSQSRFAELTNVSIDTVRRWESGEREPRTSELMRIAKVLGCNVANLIEPKKREIRLILDREGIMNLNMTSETERYVKVGLNDITLHLGGPIRTEKELNALLEEFKKLGLDALKQQEKWRLEDAKIGTDPQDSSAS